MEKYKFFNSAPGDPRTYEASDFAEYFGNVLSTGLLHTDHVPGMEVSVASGTLNTVVSAGKAIMLGRLYENTSDLTLTHSIPEATFNRIDRVVLRLDLRNSARNIHLAVKEGTASATPVPPELTRDNFIYELSLAQILVRANTSQLQQADLVDERLYEDLCGIVYSLISIPTEQFQRQWDEFIGGIEDEGFATTGYVNEQVATAETNAKNASLPRTGGTVNGTVTVNNPNLLGSAAGSIVDGLTTSFSTGNQSRLVTRAMRISNGSTWTSEAIELARYVDTTQQATLRFEGDEIRFKNADNTWTSLRELKQSGVNAKRGTVDAINAMGGSASTNDSWDTLHSKIRGMYTTDKLYMIGGRINHPTMSNLGNHPLKPFDVNNGILGMTEVDAPDSSYRTNWFRINENGTVSQIVSSTGSYGFAVDSYDTFATDSDNPLIYYKDLGASAFVKKQYNPSLNTTTEISRINLPNAVEYKQAPQLYNNNEFIYWSTDNSSARTYTMYRVSMVGTLLLQKQFTFTGYNYPYSGLYAVPGGKTLVLDFEGKYQIIDAFGNVLVNKTTSDHHFLANAWRGPNSSLNFKFIRGRDNKTYYVQYSSFGAANIYSYFGGLF